jgi:hypothetical protein
VEDLFRVVNQGSQPSSVYFEDSSDAVTFRVTQSTDTSTTGSSGQTLEGADNSVELAVGEQVVVGMTINTLEEEVSGQLLDSVTLYAEAGASAPEQSIPEPQYVVDGSGSDANTFATISAALSEAEAGSVVGVKPNGSYGPSAQSISTENLTVVGYEGVPVIETPNGLSGGDNFLEIAADGVTVRDLKITDDLDARGNPGGSNLVVSGNDVTIEGVQVDVSNGPTGNPVLYVGGNDVTITDTKISGGPIAGGGGGSHTITGNYVNKAVDEGIWFSSNSADFDIRDNKVDDHDTDLPFNSPHGGTPDGNAEIKLVNPGDVNDSSSNKNGAILAENSIKTAEVSGDIDTIGGGEISAQFYAADEGAGGFPPTAVNSNLTTALIGNGGSGSSELEIHGASGGGNDKKVGDSLSGQEQDFSVTIDPGQERVDVEAAGDRAFDSDLTDGDGFNGSDVEKEFPDGVPDELNIAVNLRSLDDIVLVKDLTISGSTSEVSGYKMATSDGDTKSFEFTDVPADGTVTVSGTVFIGDTANADALGIDFADPQSVN